MDILQKRVFPARLTWVVLGALLCSASAANAQPWKKLGTLPTAMYCAYFFDSTHGVVAGVGTIWRYNNGSWSNPSIEPTGTVSYFSSIRMLRPGVLYATSGDDYVWYSSDSGATWQNTTTHGSFALDCYLENDSVHVSYVGTFARLDSNICIIGSNNGTSPTYSTNGGATWHNSTVSPSNLVDGYGTYADTCRKIFFASAKTGAAYYSIDSGRTWHPTGPLDTCDILNGADGSVYHETSYGVLCSVDGGTHWQFIGGPDAYGIQHNIFGFGPHGKYIVAMYNGQVWLYSKTDTLVPPDPTTRHDTTEICPISRIPVTITPYTHPLQVEMQSYSLGTQSLSPSDTIFTLQPGTSYAPLPVPAKTIWFNVTPTNGQHPSKIFRYTSITDGCRMFDWTDTFTIFPVPLPISTPSVQFQNCIVSRIPLVIQPNSQALRMHVTFTADSGWSVLPAFTNVQLPSGTRDTIYLTPTAPNSGVGSIVHLHATDTSACTIYTWDTTFTISILPVPVSFTWVDSIRISSCDSARIPIILDLAACDSLIVDQLVLFPTRGANAPLTIESAPNLPLARGKMDTLWLLYAPHGLADSTNYQIKITSHFVPEGFPLDTALKLKAVSTGTINPHASAAAGDTMKECSPVSLPVIIKAAGCEDISIDSIVFNEVGIVATGGLAAVDTLEHGQSDTLQYTIEALYPGQRTLDITCYLYRLTGEVQFDTTLSVALTVTGTGGQPLISVPSPLSLSNCDTSVIPVILYAPCDTAKIALFKLTADTLHYNVNLNFPLTLQPDTYDTLLISFPPQGLNRKMAISAEISGIYGGTTNRFDNTVQSYVTFSCVNGVTEERQFGTPLAISGLKTSSGKLLFEISKNDQNLIGCDAEIVSMLGEVVAKRSIQLSSSQNQVNWDINGLASGEYFLRIVSGDYRLSSRFVLVR